LAHNTQQVCGETIPDLCRGACGTAEIGIETVIALLFKNQREDFFFQISLLIKLALRIILSQAGIGLL